MECDKVVLREMFVSINVYVFLLKKDHKHNFILRETRKRRKN